MTSKVVFKVDSKVKAKAMKRAKKEGVPFASVLKTITQDFAEGKYSFKLVREIPNARTARILRAARADFKKGKNISPAFSSGKDMDLYLGL